MLTVCLPVECRREREYAAELVFNEMLGLDVALKFESRRDVAIRGPGESEVVLSDQFFPLADSHWLDERSMPRMPLARLPIEQPLDPAAFCEPTLPILFGSRTARSLTQRDRRGRLALNVDVLGSVFFLTSRYEEMVSPLRDDRGRFPMEASTARQADFIDRPLADEYVALLAATLKLQWPGLNFRRHQYRFLLSHDVDTPYWIYGRGVAPFVMGLAADLLISRSVRRAERRVRAAAATWRRGPVEDPYNSFPFIFQMNDRYGMTSAFYFITKQRAGRLDGTHLFESAPVCDLLRDIHRRGHEIGVHPSYGSFDHPEQIAEEYTLLRQQCETLAIDQTQWGGRQHYLRWQNPTTWHAWDDAGLDYDSTLGYADGVGFRCGTCREFPVYDLERRRALGLRERPLAVMDCALSFARPRPDPACLTKLQRVLDNCRKMKGNFTLLWHNNNLASEHQRQAYVTALEMAA